MYVGVEIPGVNDQNVATELPKKLRDGTVVRLKRQKREKEKFFEKKERERERERREGERERGRKNKVIEREKEGGRKKQSDIYTYRRIQPIY